MSLVYKAAQVVACMVEPPKDWNFGGKTGTSHTAKLACVSATGEVSSIKLKAKTADELKAKVAKYPIGKPAEITIADVIPLMRQGERKSSGFELGA